MKAGIHPEYHKINVVMTNGTKFETYSTYGKEGDTLQLDVDPISHPAWNGGGSTVNQKASRITRFNNLFGSIGGAQTPDKKDDKKEDNDK